MMRLKHNGQYRLCLKLPAHLYNNLYKSRIFKFESSKNFSLSFISAQFISVQKNSFSPISCLF